MRVVLLDWWIGTIPNAINSSFESGVAPNTAFNSRDNNALCGGTETNLNCSGLGQPHDNAATEREEAIGRIVEAATVYLHLRPNETKLTGPPPPAIAK